MCLVMLVDQIGIDRVERFGLLWRLDYKIQSRLLRRLLVVLLDVSASGWRTSVSRDMLL